MFRRAGQVLVAALLVATPTWAQMTPGAEPGDVLTVGQLVVEVGAGTSLDAQNGRSTAGMQPLVRVGVLPGVEVLAGSGGWTSACFGRCAWSPTTAFAGWRASLPTQTAGFTTAVSGLFYYPTRTDHTQPRLIESSFLLHVDRELSSAVLLTFNMEVARLHDEATAVIRHGEGVGVVWAREGRWVPLARFGRRAAVTAASMASPWFVEVGTGMRTATAIEYEFTLTRGLTSTEPGWGVSAAVAYSHDFRPRW